MKVKATEKDNKLLATENTKGTEANIKSHREKPFYF